MAEWPDTAPDDEWTEADEAETRELLDRAIAYARRAERVLRRFSIGLIVLAVVATAVSAIHIVRLVRLLETPPP